MIYVFPDQYRNSSLGFWSDPEFAAEVGWKGDPVATPNLDRFAREATVLTEAVSNFPVSSPTGACCFRACIPSGTAWC